MAPRVALKERIYCDAFNDTSKLLFGTRWEMPHEQ